MGDLNSELARLRRAIISQSIQLGVAKSKGILFDNREMLYGGDNLSIASAELWKRMAPLRPDVIYGAGYGASALLAALHLRANEDGHKLTTLHVRDKRKEYAAKRLVEGPRPKAGARAIFVDDLLNSGSTFRRARAALKEDGIEVTTIGLAVILDYWQGVGSRQLEAQGMQIINLLRRHDLNMTRQEPVNTFEFLGKPLWTMLDLNRRRAGQGMAMNLKCPPLIDGNKVYAGDDMGRVHCLDRDTGDTLWRYQSPRQHDKGIVNKFQIADNRLTFGGYDGLLTQIEADTGRILWRRRMDNHLHSTPALDLKQRLLWIATEYSIWENSEWRRHGDILCADFDTGSIRWRFQTGDLSPCSPLHIPDLDLVVCGSNDRWVYALEASSGKLVWKTETFGPVKGRALWDAYRKQVIVTTTDGWAYGLGADNGAEHWKRRVGFSTIHSYPLSLDRDRFVVTDGIGMVLALRKEDCCLDWISRQRSSVSWMPVSADREGLLITTSAGQMSLLDPTDGHKTWSKHLNTPIWQPPSLQGEYLAVATNRKGLQMWQVNRQPV